MKLSDNGWAEKQLDFLVEVIWGHMFSTPEEVCKTLQVKPIAVAQRLVRLGRREYARPYYRLNNRIQKERKMQKLAEESSSESV